MHLASELAWMGVMRSVFDCPDAVPSSPAREPPEPVGDDRRRVPRRRGPPRPARGLRGPHARHPRAQRQPGRRLRVERQPVPRLLPRLRLLPRRRHAHPHGRRDDEAAARRPRGRHDLRDDRRREVPARRQDAGARALEDGQGRTPSDARRRKADRRQRRPSLSHSPWLEVHERSPRPPRGLPDRLGRARRRAVARRRRPRHGFARGPGRGARPRDADVRHHDGDR